MMLSTIVWLAAAAAQPAATPAEAPATTPAMTIQQRFDQAMSQANSGQCPAAITAFEALETRPAFRDGTLPGAMLTLAKGQCLIKTGRDSDGEAAIRAALPRMRQQGATFNVDIASALLSLGDAAMNRWDYAGARRSYEEAAAIPEGTHPVVVNVKLAQATAFDGGDAPLRYADAALQGALAAPDISKSRLAEYHALRAQILLNQGRNADAYTALKEALKLTGGLDLSVSLADVAMRSDLALAARLNGDDERARRYLAYTGAGRIEESPFARALAMDAPVCGMQTGLRPEDFAVVNFAIDKDGRVIGARTAYSRGNAEVAAAFARAVSDWRWDPKTLEKIPPFYRAAPRVEIRCTTQGQQVPQLITPVSQRFVAWAAGILNLSDTSDKTALGARLDALAREKPAGAAQVAVPGLQFMTHQVGSRVASYQLLQKALLAASDPAVPAEARNALKIIEMSFRANRWDEKSIPDTPKEGMIALMADPEIAGDALAANTVRLLAAEPQGNARSRPDGANALYEQVASDARLADHHPLRQAAHLRLADDAARRGDLASAQSHFAATGLTEEQCAYLGVQPAMRRTGLTNSDFPNEALSWGFEGWVQLEFDVAGNGGTANIRPLMAYPPFIFSDAAARSARDTRYEASFRPGGSTACNAKRLSIRYRIDH